LNETDAKGEWTGGDVTDETTDEMKPAPFAQIAFALQQAEHDFEEAVFEAAGDSGFDFSKINWDSYDSSIEFYGVKPDARMNDAVQKVVFDAGFGKAYVNHTDGWETHYGFYDMKKAKDFKPQKGDRIKYGYKQGENPARFYVEEFPEGWPKEWKTNGSVVIVKPTVYTEMIETKGELGESGLFQHPAKMPASVKLVRWFKSNILRQKKE
jgi:hypothetical protein